MKITVLGQEGNTLTYLIEREQGQYNNIVEQITLTDTEGLSQDEIKTLGFIKLKPLAKRVFEAIEPLDESDTAEGFNLIPSRTAKTEVFAQTSVIVGSEAVVTKQFIDQYGQATHEYINIDTSTVGEITVEGKTVSVITAPKPEPTAEDYLLDLDYRLSKNEMGV